jgi:hypothetical protein
MKRLAVSPVMPVFEYGHAIAKDWTRSHDSETKMSVRFVAVLARRARPALRGSSSS